MATVEPIRSKKDIKKIEQLLANQNERDLLLFILGINCGLRISDILSLNIEDIKNKNYIQITEKKTGKYKKFPINSKLKPMLNKFAKGRSVNEPLFKSKFNNRLDRTAAYRIIHNACKQIKLEGNIGTHTLRKTFGYHHYKMFKDVVVLQKIFNHSTPQITMRYIGIEQDEIDKMYYNFIL
ncbi:site-specific integrase [bacterium]|nr:site-specific integrase [bacterium]